MNVVDQTEMFGKYAGQQLQKYHVVPVQITIENQSTTAWVLTDKNIALNRLTIDQVNAKLFASRRLIPLWIFLGGAAIAALCGLVGLIGAIRRCRFRLSVNYGRCLYAIAGVAAFATSCVIDNFCHFKSMSRNEMQRYLKTYCTTEGLTFNEGMSASMLFFVEESKLPEKLNLVLTDKASEKHTLPFELAI